MIVTGLVGDAPVLLNTGTVTSESLTITSVPNEAWVDDRDRIVCTRDELKGAAAETERIDHIALVTRGVGQTIDCGRGLLIPGGDVGEVDIYRGVASDGDLDAAGNAFLVPGGQRWATCGQRLRRRWERSGWISGDSISRLLARVVGSSCSRRQDKRRSVAWRGGSPSQQWPGS